MEVALPILSVRDYFFRGKNLRPRYILQCDKIIYQ